MLSPFVSICICCGVRSNVRKLCIVMSDCFCPSKPFSKEYHEVGQSAEGGVMVEGGGVSFCFLTLLVGSFCGLCSVWWVRLWQFVLGGR